MSIDFLTARQTTSVFDEHLWGISPSERFTHPHDFRYAIWIEKFDVILEDMERSIDSLREKKAPLNVSDEKSLVSRVATKELAIRAHEQWSRRVQRLRFPMTCEWCGRFTTIGYMTSDGHFRVAGSNSFTNFHNLRGLGAPHSVLCPACGFSADSGKMGPVDHIPSLNWRMWSIAYHPDTQWEVFTYQTPWYQWSWDRAPALWVRCTDGGSSWSRKPWLTSTVPTLDPRAAMLWFNGRLYPFNAQSLQYLADRLVGIIDSLPLPMNNADLTAVKQTYENQTAPLKDALRAALNLPRTTESHALLRWLFIPKANKLFSLPDSPNAPSMPHETSGTGH